MYLVPTDLSRVLDANPSAELEARFGSPSITRKVYKRVYDYLASRANPVYTHTRDSFYGKERYTTVYDEYDMPAEMLRTTKEEIYRYPIDEYQMRIVAAREDLTQVDRLPQTRPTMVREKKRYSVTVYKSRIDLTEVTTYSGGINARESATTTYELEVEALDKKDLAAFEQVLKSVLLVVQDTIEIYKESEKRRVIRDVNRLLGVKKPCNYVDVHALIQPRNLKVRDLHYGAIVPRSDKDVKYTVTIKADGVRKLLVVLDYGMYLVYSDQIQRLSRGIKDWHGTIFECEVIPKDKLSDDATDEHRQARVYALIYDALVFGGQSIKGLSYFQRIEYAQKFVAAKSPGLVLELKEFHRFSTVHDFYAAVERVLSASYPYKTDGLIFTPDNYQYDPSVSRLKLSERKLHIHPDILKWKPPSQLTIDFAIEHVGDGIRLLCKDGKDLVPFSPAPDAVVIDDQLRTSPNRSVFEFAWNADESKFVVVRPRDDKPFPNSVEIAHDVWADINSPLDKDTITGQRFSLIFRYYNNVKRDLYKSLPKTAKTLLDIGSGRGADVTKWIEAGYTHIVCVEPNEERRTELERRLSTTIRNRRSDAKYRIVATTGQDVQRILEEVQSFVPGGRVDVLSYMLSLSFFFDSEESMDSIAILARDAVKPGGYFVALTIDQSRVLEYFSDPTKYIEVEGERRAHLSMIDMRLIVSDSYKLYVDIPNSIVDKQTEYLVDVESLIEWLETLGYTIVDKYVANREKFLTDEELEYSELFTALVAKYS